MNNKFPNQLVTGVSFGITSGVITALGMIVGLHEATSSRLAVFAGIVDDNLFHIYIAKLKNESAIKLVIEHVSLAVVVITISYFTGKLIGGWIQ